MGSQWHFILKLITTHWRGKTWRDISECYLKKQLGFKCSFKINWARLRNAGMWGGDKTEWKTTEDFCKWSWGRRGGKERAEAVTVRGAVTKGSLVVPINSSTWSGIAQGHSMAQEERARGNCMSQGQPVYAAGADLQHCKLLERIACV